MILDVEGGGGLQAINFFKQIFCQRMSFSEALRMDPLAKHIMAKFDIKSMVFNFFR